MTTYKGIAAVTQTLAYLTGAAARAAVPEATVTVARPEQPAAGSANAPRLNVYLVQVVPDPTKRSGDLPTRDGNGHMLSLPQAPLILRYLLSFFGSSDKAHLMLGAVELVLRERPTLDATLIRQALADRDELQDSGLEAQVPPVRMVPHTVTLEELTRFWAGFHQMPYTLSTVYDAATVVLTAPGVVTPDIPVAAVKPGVGGMPPQLDPLPPVTYDAGGTSVPVGGHGVTAGQYVRVGGTWAVLAEAAGRLQFALPADVPAGTQTVQLGAAAGGGQPEPIPGSRPQTVLIRPQLRSIEAVRRELRALVGPPVHAGQRAALNLIAIDGVTGGAQISAGATPAPSTDELVFDAPPSLPAGSYLAVLDVDGASSQPTVADGHDAGPIVELSR